MSINNYDDIPRQLRHTQNIIILLIAIEHRIKVSPNVIETVDILKGVYIHAHVKKATRKWNGAEFFLDNVSAYITISWPDIKQLLHMHTSNLIVISRWNKM